MGKPEVEKKPTLPFIRPDLFTFKDGVPYLVGSKCQHCGRVYFPKRTICYDCKKLDPMPDVLLSRKGELKQGIVVGSAPVGFTAPYVVGYVMLPEGVKLFTQLVKEGVSNEDMTDDELTPGRDVEVLVEKIREDDDGNDVIGFKFKLL